MSDDSEQLGPRARSLVETGRTLDQPADTDRRRVRARLTAALGVSALTAAGTQAAAASLGAGGGATAATATSMTVEGAAAGTSAATATAGAGTAAGTAAVSSGLWTTLGAKTAVVFAAAAVSAVVGTVALRPGATAPAGGAQAPSAPTTRQAANTRGAGTTAPAHSGADAQPSTTSLPARAGAKAAPDANAQLAAAPDVPSATRSPAPALPAVARARAVPRDVRGGSESIVAVPLERPSARKPVAPTPPERGAPVAAAPLATDVARELPDNSSATLPASTASVVATAPNAETSRPAPPVAKPPPLAGELSLLADAQLALREHRLASALELLDKHAFRYPRGALRPERLAARAVVMCRMERRAEGQAELEQLKTETPSSPLLAWARSACGL